MFQTIDKQLLEAKYSKIGLNKVKVKRYLQAEGRRFEPVNSHKKARSNRTGCFFCSSAFKNNFPQGVI
jgi:hypothetical protein